MDSFIGSIILFAGNFAPQGWLLCQGQLLPVNQNQALFSILGNRYGGNGTTTFALPDLRGRAPVQTNDNQTTQPPAGTGTLVLGQYAGNQLCTIPPISVTVSGSVTLNANQLPPHTHPASAAVTVVTAASADDDIANGNVLAPGTTIYNSTKPVTGGGTLGGVSATVNVGNNTGGAPIPVSATGLATPSAPVTTQSPVLALNYIICVVGLYPERP